MNRRDALTMTGLGAVATLPQLYPARAETAAREACPQPVPSRVQYRVKYWDEHKLTEKRSIAEFLNEETRDGFELVTIRGHQYVFGKRVPLEASA